jgi:Ca2+-binding RTX toxin-like protein
LVGGGGADSISAGTGNDVIVLSLGAGAETLAFYVDGGEGSQDSLLVRAAAGFSAAAPLAIA